MQALWGSRGLASGPGPAALGQGVEGLCKTKASSSAKGWKETMLERGFWRKEPSIGEGRRGQQGLAWGRTRGGKEDRGTAVCFLHSQPA